MTVPIDAIFAILAILFALFLASEAAFYGHPNRTHCGAPTRKRGHCRNVIAGGRQCAARHSTSWMGGYYTFAVLSLLGALLLLLLQPATNLLDFPPLSIPTA